MTSFSIDHRVWKRRTYKRLHQFVLLQLCVSLVFSATVQEACPKDDRYDASGEICSPGYPSSYPSFAQCKWHIYHEPNEVITISFKEFDIEEGPDGNLCTADVLRIVDKQSQIYCGNEIPTPYISALSDNSRLLISFESDSSTTGAGFVLEYYKGVFPAKSCDAETEFFCENKKCIPLSWLCNGMDECGDRSDEAISVCHEVPSHAPATGSTTVSQCPPHTMYCLKTADTSQCLPEDKKCDGSRDCLHGEDEEGCETICNHQLEQDVGSFTSPRYPENYPNNLTCRWTIVVSEGNIVQLRFQEFNLEQGYQTDYVQVYDGSSEYSDQIGTYYGYKSEFPSTSNHLPPHVIEGTGNRLYIIFVTDSRASSPGFNATFQTKGLCIGEQRLCSDKDENCYAPNQHCDGELTCLKGQDEMGCHGCPSDQIPCDASETTIKCYSATDRCNGQSRCNSKEDEKDCPALLCNSQEGAFLCENGMCIQENWWCDTNEDCTDGSDEVNCPMSTKVITAAVVGSIVCGLLLVAALSCTCKLYQLYHSDPHPPTHTSPLREIEDELMRREAPPSYTASMSSPHFDEAQRAFIESLQAAAQARQESGGRDARTSTQRLPGLFGRGGTRPQQEGQAQPSEHSPASPDSVNTTQDTLSTTDSTTISPTHSTDTRQQNPAAAPSSAASPVEDSSSPYTEITDIRPPTRGGDTASSCTTDTDSDTNAEAEIELMDRDIIRAATNIRRMRLAGGIQTLVERVTEQQREDASVDGETRRRSSSGLQNIMERINRTRENHNREDTREGDCEPGRGDPTEDATASAPELRAAEVPHVVARECSTEQQNSLNHQSSSSRDEGERDSIPPSGASAQPSEGQGLDSSGSDTRAVQSAPLSDNKPRAQEEEENASEGCAAGTPPPPPARRTSDDDAPLDLSESNSADYQDGTLIEEDDLPLIC